MIADFGELLSLRGVKRRGNPVVNTALTLDRHAPLWLAMTVKNLKF